MELKKSAGIAEGSLASAGLTLACIPIIFCVAETNYRFIETRFRRMGRRLADGLRQKWDDRRSMERTPLVAE
jgi:peptidoglycan/LPS O-acetylase OafA/YrhL